MTRYVALLRAIGPPSHTKMPLGELVARCNESGLEDVLNVGNTGNLLFGSGQPQAAVEAIVTEAVASFGVGNEVFTRTQRQIQMLVGLAPFAQTAADHPDRLTVCFFHTAPRWPADYLSYAGPEQMRMFSNHLIVDYGTRGTVSRLSIEKTVGARMTERNWNTVLRLAAKLSVSPAGG